MVTFNTVAEYSAYNNNETLHPLVNMVDLSLAPERKHVPMHIGLYMILLKEIKCGDMRYGCNYYDYDEGTLVFLAPGQVIGFDDTDSLYKPQGKVVVFHPDFLHGTSLGQQIHKHSFFSYNTNEALHLSEMERRVITDGFFNIGMELKHAIDKHTRKLIVSNIELLLNYATRFYDRQFITREVANQGILERFETLLNEYYNTKQAEINGVPTVSFCADQLHISANYLGDMIKRETGKSAHDYIHSTIIDRAKELMFVPKMTVSEIAYELGFKYPQHFTRLFKNRVGISPIEYKLMNKNSHN